jgi:hypothetical protein
LFAQTRTVQQVANKIYLPSSVTIAANPGTNTNNLNCTASPSITLTTQQIFNCTYDSTNKALFITLINPLPVAQGGTGQSGTGTAGQCLVSGGAGQPMTWGTCGSGSGLPSGGSSSQVLVGGSPSTWGSVPAAAMPLPTASSLGGVQSITATAHNWISYIDTTGAPHLSQPTYPDLSGTVPTWNQSTTGNAATATALAAAPTQCGGNQFATGIAASGSANCAQPTFSNLSGSASAAQIPNVPTQIATSGSNSDPGGASYYQFCNYTSGCTFTAPAGVAGLQRCYRNSTGVTAVLTVQMAASNTVDLNGGNGSSGGYLASSGALGDSVCIVSDSTNHWYAYAGGGTWTNH